jgi:hypothetical protein
MRRLSSAFVCLFVFAAGMSAGERDPWTVSNSERLTRRFDAIRIAKRDLVPVAEEAAPQVSIDGADSPELFLPGELMALFLANVTDIRGTPKGNARQSYSEAIAGYSWDATLFWCDFEEATAEYNRLLAARTDADPSWEENRRICSSRASALRTMRDRYPRFEEFLYRAVASRSALTVSSRTSREWLLWIEGGCQ